MSRFPLGEGVMGFSGDDSAFQSTAERVERKMTAVAAKWQSMSSFSFTNAGLSVAAKDIEAVGNAADVSEKQLSGFLTRAGRFGAFSIAATGLRDMAKAAQEFTEKIAAGKANTEDLIEAMLKKLPFGIGKVIEAGRDIHGLLTGETAKDAKTEADTKSANEKIELQKRLATAILGVTRQAQDARQSLDFNVSKSQFFNSAASIIKAGERAGEDLVTQRTAQEKLLSEANARKIDLARQLDDIKRESEFTHTTDPGEESTLDLGRQSRLSDKQKELDKAAEQVRALTTQLDNLNAVLTEKGGRPTFTALANLVGGQVVKAFDSAGAAVGRFIGRNREVNATTAEMIKNFSDLAQSHAGNIGTFQNQQNALGIDLSRGAITPDVFKALSNKSFFDQAARSVGSILQQYAPIAETIARLVDSNFGLSNFASRAVAAVGSVFPGKIDASTAHEFRSSTVGLTDLGRRIQEGAASSGGQQATEKYLPTMDKSLKDAADALRKLLGLNLGTVK